MCIIYTYMYSFSNIVKHFNNSEPKLADKKPIFTCLSLPWIHTG